MSDQAVAQILEALAPLRADLAETKAKLLDVERELAMARRHSTQPYYTTADLMRLARKRTPKALYAWADRKGIRSHGHNQWDRRDADTVLGLR